MSSRLRFVLDTNAVVSAAILPHSVSRQAFDLAFARGEVLVSEATFNEIDTVLRRPRFDRYIDEIKRLEFLTTYSYDAILTNIIETIVACRDAKDDKFLELAVNGNASAIISGDQDLLVLNPFRSIPIITPQQFVSRW